jgi:hypothetical protein
MDWEKFLWLPGEKKIFIPSAEQLALFDYNIAIPSIWTVGNNWYQANPNLWNIDENHLTFKIVSRSEAMKRGILREGQGLEDIDNYMKYQIELEKNSDKR